MKYLIISAETNSDSWQLEGTWESNQYRHVLNTMSGWRIENPSRHYEMHPIDERVFGVLTSLAQTRP